MLGIFWKRLAAVGCIAAVVGLLAGEVAMAPAEGIAGIGKAAHVNVAIFHVYSGDKPPAEIQQPDEAGLLTALKGEAQILALTHTTGVKDNDVLDIQADVLREGQSLEDFGVDCQLILDVPDGEHVKIGGKCQTLVWDIVNARQVKSDMLIKPTLVGKDWTLIAWDAKEHVAIYVNEEMGAE
ncbi:hypothetical protein [Alcanivorax sp.]|uniref:hypothetical protein n=1 Tax=Alcanivorax sp. TaxID=1872427 RepID=UPI00258FA117|nr:hypothetical protein [Alcanivorax sp.]